MIFLIFLFESNINLQSQSASHIQKLMKFQASKRGDKNNDKKERFPKSPAVPKLASMRYWYHRDFETEVHISVASFWKRDRMWAKTVMQNASAACLGVLRHECRVAWRGRRPPPPPGFPLERIPAARFHIEPRSNRTTERTRYSNVKFRWFQGATAIRMA